METWLRSERIYTGKIINLQTGQVRLDDGVEAFREVVEHPGGVGVVPCLGESVMLCRQYRIAVGKPVLEIPAGKLEPGDAPEHRARVELEEETGLVAARIVPAGRFYPSPGVLSETIHLFLAFDLARTAQKPEDDERIELVELPLDEAKRRLTANEFDDAKTIIGLYALLAYTKRL